MGCWEHASLTGLRRSFGRVLSAARAKPAAQTFPAVAAEVRSQLSEVQKPGMPRLRRTRTRRQLSRGATSWWDGAHEPVIARIAQFKLGFGSFDNIVLVSHGLFITTWLDHEIRLADPFCFLDQRGMPDAWELDLDEVI